MGDTNNKDMNQNGMDMEQIKEYGQAVLNNPKTNHDIHLLNIIGEIEGHECLPSTTKTTKYEHVLPQLAVIEDSEKVDGLLLILNTVGGDVESGLAIAEMVASLDKRGVPGSWGIAFYWGTAGGVYGLFVYCAERDDGDTSGAYERDGNWGEADV